MYKLKHVIFIFEYSSKCFVNRDVPVLNRLVFVQLQGLLTNTHCEHIVMAECFLAGESLEELNGYGTHKPRNLISSILGTPGRPKSHLCISNPHDFRQVRCLLV